MEHQTQPTTSAESPAIICITEREGQQAVSARDLHKFLESKKDFSSWIKDRIEKYGFLENQDYCLLTELGEQKGRGGHNRVEYLLTVDAAKELAMVEGNEKGKQARRYFIEAEKRYRQKAKDNLPQSFADALRLAADQAEAIEQQQKLLAEQAPRVLFSQAVETSKRSCLIAELAKILSQNGYPIGQNRLFSWLRENGYLCSKGDYYNQPTQRAIEMQLFEIKKSAINKPDGTVLVNNTTKVTGRGQVYFINKLLALKNKN